MKAAANSKYSENIFINNHTSVWGSWWANFEWGYACCHSIVKNSYCTGDEGKRAFEEANRLRTGDNIAESDDVRRVEWRSDSTTHAKENSPNLSLAKKRRVQEIAGGVSEEDMDAYRRKRTATNDPMAAIIGKDELV